MKKIIFLILLTCMSVFYAMAYNAEYIYTSVVSYSEQSEHGEIRSLRLKYADTDAVERPILRLGEDRQLEISFDELSHENRFYSYTLLHLDADHKPSDLLPNEYISGDLTQDITDFDQSINTQQLYTHYRFLFPNEDMQIKTSGDYALKIYEDNNTDEPVAFVCFKVVEQLVKIDGKVRGNTDIELSGRYQQLDIDLTMTNIDIKNADDIHLYVEQNGRHDNSVYNPRPTYIEGNRLRYINQKQLIFEGGNEYRHFDIASQYIMGYNVDKVYFDKTYYQAFLFADEDWSKSVYTTENDNNGQYVINVERSEDDDYEADYMWVHFLFEKEKPWFDGGVYIIGDLTYNKFNFDSRMQYDNEHKCYYKSLYLKQGAYSYQYLFKQKDEVSGTTMRTEGSHWQTENEYSIYVYYRPFGARADRIIGSYRL